MLMVCFEWMYTLQMSTSLISLEDGIALDLIDGETFIVLNWMNKMLKYQSTELWRSKYPNCGDLTFSSHRHVSYSNWLVLYWLVLYWDPQNNWYEDTASDHFWPFTYWTGVSSSLRLQQWQKEKNGRWQEQMIGKLEHWHKQTSNHTPLNNLADSQRKYNSLIVEKIEGNFRLTNQRYYEYGNRTSILLAFWFEKAAAIIHSTEAIQPTLL